MPWPPTSRTCCAVSSVSVPRLDASPHFPARPSQARPHLYADQAMT